MAERVQHSYERWQVSSQERVTSQDSEGSPVFERVVIIADPQGWQREVTLDDDLEILTSLTIRGVIDRKALRTVPLGYVRDVAATHLRDRTAAGIKRTSEPNGRPAPEVFAQLWHETPVTQIRDGKKITRRHALAELYSVTPGAIDKWTRAARDAGLLPPPTKGGRVRGRATTPVPDLTELAERYLSAETVTELTAQYRSRYGVSRATVDRWIREARDRGLIPEATTGRKRK